MDTWLVLCLLLLLSLLRCCTTAAHARVPHKPQHNSPHSPPFPSRLAKSYIKAEEVPEAVLADGLHRRVQLGEPCQPRLERLVVLGRPVDERRGHPAPQGACPAPAAGVGGPGGPVLRGVRRLEVGAGVDPGGGKGGGGMGEKGDCWVGEWMNGGWGGLGRASCVWYVFGSWGCGLVWLVMVVAANDHKTREEKRKKEAQKTPKIN